MITSDYKNHTTPVNNSVLEITVNNMQGVSFFIDNGVSYKTAGNETSVSIFSSLVNDYSPNQALYLLAVAISGSPTVNFTYRYYQIPPTCSDT